MANSPSTMSARRNKAGCMAGIAHLFDFNQGQAGRKLLTDRKHREGSDTLKDERTKVTNGGKFHDRKNSLALKRETEVPIKSLIAEEISKEPESTNRAPSVVARLMGLDALPSDSKNKLTNGGAEEVPQQSPLRLQSVKTFSNRSPGNMKDTASILAHSMSGLSFYEKSNEEGRTFCSESFPSGSSSNYSTLQEHEAWKVWKPEKAGKMEKVNLLAAKPMLIRKKTSETEIEYSQRHRAQQTKPYGTRELKDDVDYLASKNSSARFFEEQDSLSGMQIQNSGDIADVPKQFKKHAKAQFKSDHMIQADYWVEKGPFPSSVQDDTHQSYPSWGNESMNVKQHQQRPTRIVVLKPSYNRVNKLKFLSENNPKSRRDFLEAMEIIKENSMGVLHDLRQRLQQDNDFRDISRNCKLPNDPKEIAREIARQVRESVTRDLMASNVSECNEVHYPSSMKEKFFIQNSAADMRRFRHLKDMCVKNFGQQPNNSSKSGRHSVDGTDSRWNGRTALTNVVIDSDSSSYSFCDSDDDSEGEFDDEIYRTLLRSRSVPTGSFHLHNEKVEYPQMPVTHDSLAGTTNVLANRSKDGSIPLAISSKRSIFGRKHLGSRHNLAKNRKDKDTNFVIRVSSSRIGSVDIEKNQCQIDDAGPILDSDSSASSLENILSTDATFMTEDAHRREESSDQDSGGLSSEMESSVSENLAVTEPQCLETIEDSEASVHSPLMSPRRRTNLACDETMANNLKLSKNVFEQPSPVSVLDAVFQEELPNSMEFAEISSELQELKSRLQLLKYLDHETSSSSEFCHDDSQYMDEDKFTESLYTEVSKDDQMEYHAFLNNGMQCQNGKEQELLYVRDLLVASGFTGDSSSLLTRWHAPNQPLASFMFERMEDNYCNNVESTCKGTVLTYNDRHLLFDRVNEVLIELLGPEINNRRWWKDHGALTMPVPSGKVLLQRVWTGVCKGCCSRFDSQDTLVNLVSRDLSGQDRWHETDAEFELTILDVEKAIFNDLMLETVMLF